MCDEVVVIGIMPYPQTQFEQRYREMGVLVIYEL